jgi:type II secretory ATPase GspE/PulE/Tfp pilus assembly ATPase PilB-like protein
VKPPGEDGPSSGEAPRLTARELREAAVGPFAQRLSPEYMEEHCVLPLDLGPEGRLRVAVGGALDATVLDELRLALGQPLTLVEAPAAEIQAAVLSAEPSAEVTPLELRATTEGGGEGNGAMLDDLRALANEAPVIQLVNLMLLEALKQRASDVHVQSTAEGLRIRQRIDGVLHDVATHPPRYQAAVISRIKIMANLDIAERRVPQDGRVRLKLSDRELDVRVSTLPSVHGESVVLRLLDRTADIRTLERLGMDEATERRFSRLVQRPNGIILVTGPTGSGKTTTLYAALQRINTPEVKIITVEDPVEYQIDGLTQIAVNPKAGRTFATALRSILRHDPDVVMVGEMRDRETAEIAIQAALTGHLVLSTLHTNDAPSGVTRLRDMGAEPYLLAATVQGILAQRLVRRICEECGEPHELDAREREWAEELELPVEGGTFRRGRGCPRCSGTGFRGRAGIYELMVVTETIRSLVVRGESLDEIRRAAKQEGMRPLHEVAWGQAAAGVTTVGEAARIAGEEHGV